MKMMLSLWYIFTFLAGIECQNSFLAWANDETTKTTTYHHQSQKNDTILTAGKYGTIQVDIDHSTGFMSISVDKELWLNIGGTSPLNIDNWSKPLSIISSKVTNGIDESYGPFTRTTLGWAMVNSTSSVSSNQRKLKTKRKKHNNDNVLMETSVIAYQDSELVIFEQYWPRGWFPRNMGPQDEGDNETMLSAFPAIHTTSPTDLSFLSWGDCFAADISHSSWNGTQTSLFQTASHGMPLVLHKKRKEAKVVSRFAPLTLSTADTATSTRTAVISPLDNFFVSRHAASTRNEDTIDCGIRNTVTKLHKGFSHSTVFMAGHGINSTMVDWGDLLLDRGGKQRTSPYTDFILSHVGYWTDNGAYYYTGIHTNFTNSEEMFKASKADFARRQIPVRYYQWDDWWMESKGDIPGMTSWTPKPDTFPSGFTNWLKAPLALYAPMYSEENVWKDQYRFKKDLYKRGSTIPLDTNFYRDLFRNGSQIGMKMFEQDFLCSYDRETGLTKTDVMTGPEWFEQMNLAAQVTGTTLQFCMMYPHHALSSTRVSQMTNGRASDDNTRTGKDNIRPMGQNGLLFYSLGFFPSRDNVWTTQSNILQPGCGNRDYCYEPNAHADNAVALLSGGPYGLGDAVGMSNRSVVMHACRDDGVLLKPSWPLSSLDFVFTDTDAMDTLVWAAHDDHDAFRWSYIVGINLDKSVSISPRRLQGLVSRPMVAWKVDLDISAPNDLIYFSDERPFLLPLPEEKSSHSPTISHWAAAPILPNGMALLGDTSKWSTMSRRRINHLLVDTERLSAVVVGTPKENIIITYVLLKGPKPEDISPLEMHRVKCSFALSTDCKSVDYHGNTDCRLALTCTAHRCSCGPSK